MIMRSALAAVLTLGVLVASAAPAASQPVRIDGAHALYAIMIEAVQQQAGMVGELEFSSTEVGLGRLCAGEIEIALASRPILDAEIAACEGTGIGFIELPVGIDAVAFVVHRTNDWVDTVTLEDIERIWAPTAEGDRTLWSDVRPGWPDRPLALYGPHPDSTTHAMLAEALVGQPASTRMDYSALDDFDLIAQAVSREHDAFVFMSLGGVQAHHEVLRVVPVDAGAGPVEPGWAEVASGSYAPLTRLHLLYVSEAAAARPQVEAFLDGALAAMPALVERAGFVGLPEMAYADLRRRVTHRETGTVFGEGGPGLPDDLPPFTD